MRPFTTFFAITIFGSILLAGPTAARWVHQSQEVKGGVDRHIAIGRQTGHALAISCQGQTRIQLRFTSRLKWTPATRAIKPAHVALILRVDNQQPRTLTARLANARGVVVSIHESAAVVDHARTIAAARVGVIVTLRVSGKTLQEAAFRAGGAAKAIHRTLVGCGLANKRR